MLDWLPWQDAMEMSAATTATWAGTSRSRRRLGRAVRPWAKELTLVLILYAMWQYAGAWSIGRAGAAVGRGRWIWNLERRLGLPSERSVQGLVLGHRTLLHLLNEYYAYVHVPALGACLVWLFVRHRDRYPPVRTVTALVTGASLVIQLFPVAPPRLIPQFGVVDVGALVGPSDYSGGAPGIDQLSAMPSLHVGWALIVGVAIVWASTSRWRWLALLYPALTTFTVVVTGNHYWSDAIVAAALCLISTAIAAMAYKSKEVDAGAASIAVTSRLDVALEYLAAAPQSWAPIQDDDRRVVGTLSISDVDAAYRRELTASTERVSQVPNDVDAFEVNVGPHSRTGRQPGGPLG